MSEITITGSALGTPLQQLLMADAIEPGSAISYQLCKEVYLYHPLGAKLAEAPIAMAQSQAREISISKGPEDRIKKAFADEWKAIEADKLIFNVMRLSRVYGVASVALIVGGMKASDPIDYANLWKQTIAFNVLDPLNTAGSLVLNQTPNAADFLKSGAIAVSGVEYHPSRVVVKMNEEPIYLGYTVSAFGYVGRSVYQRALFPLKSFVQSMITDDMVTKKAGVLVAMIKAAGSIVDRAMQTLTGIKRSVLKEAATDNVISIGHEDKVESLNMENIDKAMVTARTNVLKNIATSAGMPASLVENETMVSGFGEGTEDAKNNARYVDSFRAEMAPLYTFFDQIVMHRAWNPAFYETIQAEFPDDYKDVKFNQAFYEWKNSFVAEWPSLLTEPDSAKVQVEDVKLKAMIAFLEVLMPKLDPDNTATVIQWAIDNFNALKMLFPIGLTLDLDALQAYVPPEAQIAEEPSEPMPFAKAA